MTYAYPGDGALDYFPCRYGKSKLLFRGPHRELDRPFCAVLGGTETYGNFVADPYPALVEQMIGLRMVNLGCVNAGPDVFLNEPAVIEVASRARATVVQILGAQNLTNRYYAVHPRRNDRFLRASDLLMAIFPEVDFTEFHFTRHMLQALQSVDTVRFDVVADELRAAWVARMTELLRCLPGKVLLLWVAGHEPGRASHLMRDPILVNADMIAAVRGHAADYLAVVSSPEAQSKGVEGMAFAPLDRLAAALVPGPAVHREVAQALGPRLIGLL